MRLLASLLYLVVLVFFLLLLVRLVLDWVQVFARDWRPTGFVLVVAEVTYSVTDPPLRALRRVLPPIGIGSVRFDLAFLVLALVCSLLLQVLGRLS
ncbi:YggT family protein [Cellulomonas sp. zg-ZUI222]|uniref:YggT family protein n=1 Tax=Cellulomonas wangleii TaxID=2816956 RepID=A0ABX8DAB2_9CELL|nr:MULTISPECIES: YggT family protein [Cellulomonas]MBO0900610.1 YggT family protein [Cellulomonas sp. zg-ZUI22]MBO0921278.1 YggT family protein [Cellulomonas wangleii]MBO0925694.1 YggT family protein [Cellulomonas wangleii]QVI63775.1 YggT family protein [Cellulomonas wangleii]